VYAVVNVVMQRFTQGMGVAFSVWTVLIGVSVIAVVVAMARGWREALLRARVRAAASTLRRARARERAELLAAFAGEVTEAQRLATQSVRERRDEWEAARRTLEAAWQARCAVDVVAARLAFAALPSNPEPSETVDAQQPDLVELAGRGRLLRRQATEAYRRGDLSGSQLVEVLTGRGAWSARHDLVELETRLCMAARDHRRRQYQAAVDAERTAWDALEAARGSQDALSAVQPELAGALARSAPLPVTARSSRSWWTARAQGWQPRPSDG
jgi:hypothetical protein